MYLLRISRNLSVLSSLDDPNKLQLKPYALSMRRPLALLLHNTLRPPVVAILVLKPCLRFLTKLLGWYVLFVAILFS